MVSRLLSVAEAAKEMNVSERFVRRLVFERRLEVVKLGRLVRIPSSALEEFMEAGRREANPHNQ
jgi:excisionase family DNA binding protein